MNGNDKLRTKCVNNQLCEQLCVTLHREPPKKWHREAPRLAKRQADTLKAELEGHFL